MPVVAGVDESPVSALVVARAIEQARWRETDVHLVHAVSLTMTYTEVAIDWNAIADAERAAVWGALESAVEGADVPIEKVDLDGYPPDALVAYAEDVDAELVVVGTRGRGDFASLILGSTSHRAIHLAGCDVLVVKATQSDA